MPFAQSAPKTLQDLRVGQTATVHRVLGSGAVRRRIMDMGITRGVRITLLRTAPLGDPMELQLRGYRLSLRRADAAQIEIEAEHEPQRKSRAEKGGEPWQN